MAAGGGGGGFYRCVCHRGNGQVENSFYASHGHGLAATGELDGVNGAGNQGLGGKNGTGGKGSSDPSG